MDDMKFSTVTDVWSFGVVLLEITSGGQLPYAELNGNAEVICGVMGGYRAKQPVGCSDPLFAVMMQCWSDTPSNRPSFDHLVDMLEMMSTDTNSAPAFGAATTSTSTTSNDPAAIAAGVGADAAFGDAAMQRKPRRVSFEAEINNYGSSVSNIKAEAAHQTGGNNTAQKSAERSSGQVYQNGLAKAFETSFAFERSVSQAQPAWSVPLSFSNLAYLMYLHRMCFSRIARTIALCSYVRSAIVLSCRPVEHHDFESVGEGYATRGVKRPGSIGGTESLPSGGVGGDGGGTGGRDHPLDRISSAYANFGGAGEGGAYMDAVSVAGPGAGGAGAGNGSNGSAYMEVAGTSTHEIVEEGDVGGVCHGGDTLSSSVTVAIDGTSFASYSI
jgi:hypothetical protein